ncbi:MAG: GNAT family N-acetyltransferase [Halanaerobiales bacterium]|nr:GNAT family N-acetyltransferase [Halanaerobiales bacterium]
MENKIIVRYFYVPVCPESFATLNRLKKLFSDDERFHFESFNLIEDNIQSNYPWFLEEEEVLKTCAGLGDKPLLFVKLFINGEEIKGFPPSPKWLKEVFEKHDLNWIPERYPFSYSGSVERIRWDCEEEKFSVNSYTEGKLLDVSCLCTVHNPFLEQKSYCQCDWEDFEGLKKEFIVSAINREEVVGLIGYYNDEPAGFIEAFSLPLAAKMGFPVSSLNSKGLMITCLSIRTEVKGYGLASRLVRALEDEAREKGYESVEVLAFPDHHNWQPRSFYEKLGFVEVREVGIMRKTL